MGLAWVLSKLLPDRLVPLPITPTYDPRLSEADIAAIKQSLQAHFKTEKRILRILLMTDGNAEVQTGFIAGPRAGGGQYVILENPGWKVLSVRRWVS